MGAANAHRCKTARRQPGRWSRLAIGAVACLALLVPTPALAATAKRPKFAANATVVRVDGPGRLTLKTSTGTFPMRLALLDMPEPGECGADEATTVLRRLTTGRRARVRYVLHTTTPDAEGRFDAAIGPRNADLTERSLAQDLLTREWALLGGRITVSEADGIALKAGSEPFGPRPSRGLWARCGGLAHLPANQPAPASTPANWTITPDGITTAIGPISLPATLAPGTLPTVEALRPDHRIETAVIDTAVCRARIPSLGLVAYTNTMGAATCENGELFAFSTYGPGAATTNTGLRIGSPITDAPKLFPRLAKTLRGQVPSDDRIPLAGYAPAIWTWTTQALPNERTRTIAALATRTTDFPS